MLFLILYPVFGVQLVDVCNYTNNAKDVDDTEDDPEESAVAKVNGDGFKRDGKPENKERANALCRSCNGEWELVFKTILS